MLIFPLGFDKYITQITIVKLLNGILINFVNTTKKQNKNSFICHHLFLLLLKELNEKHFFSKTNSKNR